MARVDAGVSVFVGDVVVARQNRRDLMTTKGVSVANRHTFTVTAIAADGGLTVAGATGTVTLPPEYVAGHVQPAYASTVHGAQGRTADRSITIVEPATDHHGFYAAMTRGRHSNIAIVTTPENTAPVDVIAGVLSRDWAERPAITRAVEIEQQQRVDIPENSMLRRPDTARQQQATVQPSVRSQVLAVEALGRLVAERDGDRTRLGLAPGRLANTARQLDQTAARIGHLEPRVIKAAALVEQARAALAARRDNGWLTRDGLTKTERARYEHVLNIVPPQLTIEQGDLARLRERQMQLTETLGKWRDYTDQAPARLAAVEDTIGRDAKACLEQAIRTRQFAPDLGRHIGERAGRWPTEQGIRP